MTKELEEALRNVDIVIAGVRMTRDEHATLVRNVRLIHDALQEKEKPKEDKPDGDSND
ncbi:MAG: hypothetical protein MUP81_03100 [Dehalococcoidia bacterium]|nr:hypothetical protein [Dehalococcoidia bacterium]